MARHNGFSHKINTLQRRVTLTLAYLKLVSPDTDQSKRPKLADSILALVDGENCAMPQKRITDAQVVEMVWRHSQCALNRMGKCPLLVFGNQLADDLNEFFGEDE